MGNRDIGHEQRGHHFPGRSARSGRVVTLGAGYPGWTVSSHCGEESSLCVFNQKAVFKHLWINFTEIQMKAQLYIYKDLQNHKIVYNRNK